MSVHSDNMNLFKDSLQVASSRIYGVWCDIIISYEIEFFPVTCTKYMKWLLAHISVDTRAP